MTNAQLSHLGAAPKAPDIAGAPARDISPAYWFTMFAASAFGTNLGDFWVDDLSLDRITSFVSLVIVCSVAIVVDRRWGTRTEIGFWTAIVMLRAAATNCADYLTHDLGFNYALVTAVLGLATLVTATLTRADSTRRGAPVTDLRFWAAMLLAGLFGTAGGDLASHLVGLGSAAIGLGVILMSTIIARRASMSSLLIGYWIVLLVERTAATPAGDWLASRHGAGLGLPVAMMCTGALLAVGLTLRLISGERVRADLNP